MKAGDLFLFSDNGGKDWVNCHVARMEDSDTMAGTISGSASGPIEWMLAITITITAAEMTQFEAGLQAKATWGLKPVLIKLHPNTRFRADDSFLLSSDDGTNWVAYCVDEILCGAPMVCPVDDHSRHLDLYVKEAELAKFNGGQAASACINHLPVLIKKE